MENAVKKYRFGNNVVKCDAYFYENVTICIDARFCEGLRSNDKSVDAAKDPLFARISESFGCQPTCLLSA